MTTKRCPRRRKTSLNESGRCTNAYHPVMILPRQKRRSICLCALFAGLSLMQACGQYTIIGKVIEGELSSATFVAEDDPTVAMRGVSGASVSILRDPDKPNRAIAGEAQADDLGFFEMPIEGVGAGWMVEEWLVRSERSGFAPSAAHVALPASPRRFYLLITMRRGAATSLDERDTGEDLRREVEKYR